MLSRRELLVVAGCAAAAACGGGLATLAANGGIVTLTFAQFPSLAMAGGGVVIDVTGHDPIAVVRPSDTASVALDAVCTHEGCTVGFDQTKLHCDCHGSEFGFDGAVLQGPANRPLRHFNATLTTDAILVDVG
jgi:Rieske Fe-S protein